MLRHLLLFLLSAAALARPAAAAEELRLLPPWRDALGVRLAWHDPTGIRAVVESSTDLKHWFHEQGIYQPGVTNYVFHPESPMFWSRPGTPPWQTPFGLAYRLRRVPVLREGRVTFANRNTAAGVNAPVTFLGDMRPGSPAGGSRLADSQFLAQLLVDLPGIYRGPVGVPVPFRSGSFAGLIPGTVVLVPVPDTTDEIQVTMVAWFADLGETFG